MEKETGGQAFPVAGSEHNYPVEGMTLRDYFAAKAMIIIGEPDSYVGIEKQREATNLLQVKHIN